MKRAGGPKTLTNPVLVGATIVIALIIGVFLSYNANRGLPFVKTFDLQADVPDAAELVVGSEVRIGGFRVGQVNRITAVPPKGDTPPYAQLDLALDGTIKSIPADTVVRVRPRSLLGAKFVELTPGDGRELDSGSELPLANARSTVELDEAFNVFDADTRKGLQGTIRGLGDALAGRGPDLNRSIAAMRRLLPPLQRVSTTLADRDTNLAGFVDGLASAMGGLAPVSGQLGDLLGNVNTTFAAVNGAGPALERALARLPGTFAEGTTTLRDLGPVLRDLADLTVALQRATVQLPADGRPPGGRPARGHAHAAPHGRAGPAADGDDPGARHRGHRHPLPARRLAGVRPGRPAAADPHRPAHRTAALQRRRVVGAQRVERRLARRPAGDLARLHADPARRAAGAPGHAGSRPARRHGPAAGRAGVRVGQRALPARPGDRAPRRPAAGAHGRDPPARRRHRRRAAGRPARPRPGSLAMTIAERPSPAPAPAPRPRRRRPRNRVRIALFGILVIAAIVYGVFAKRVPFLHGYRLEAVFQSSNQLTPGFSPVRIAGVGVGKVVKVSDGPGATSVVTMELDDSALPVHADARARIRPRLFLEGGFYVDLQPGSPSAADLGSGDTIPIAQTSIPVQFSQILSSFDRSTREDLQDLIASLDQGLGDGGAEALGRAWKPLGPVLRDTAQIAEAARGPRPHDASDAIRDTSKVTAALASREADLRGLVTALARTTTTLARHDAQVAGTVREADRLLTELPGTLDAIDRSVPAVRRFADALRPTLRVAPPVLRHAAQTLDQLGGLVSQPELGATIAALQPTLARAPALERRLDALLPLVTPVTDCVRDRVLPVLNGVAPDGPLSTGRPVWQDLAHALVGLAGAGQSFDANGFNVRYLVSPPPAAGASEAGGAGGGTTGARPQYLGPGVTPPFRPDVPCTSNGPVDLGARGGAQP